MEAILTESQIDGDIMIEITWEEVFKRIKRLPSGSYYGIPRGGAIVSGLTGNPVAVPEEADFIVDDILDSGATSEKYKSLYPNTPLICLVDKQKENISDWVVFPWEKKADGELNDNVVRIIQGLGEDPLREGLRETPKRHIRYLKEFLNPKEFNFTTFKNEGIDEMIVQSNIPFFSLCEHHLLPFMGTAAVAYIPKGKIVGLSKIARVVDKFSRRFQNQERITHQIAQYMDERLEPLGVAVLLRARHLCMEMRGIKTYDTWTTTTCLKGSFLNENGTKAEFLQVCGHRI